MKPKTAIKFEKDSFKCSDSDVDAYWYRLMYSIEGEKTDQDRFIDVVLTASAAAEYCKKIWNLSDDEVRRSYPEKWKLVEKLIFDKASRHLLNLVARKADDWELLNPVRIETPISFPFEVNLETLPIEENLKDFPHPDDQRITHALSGD